MSGHPSFEFEQLGVSDTVRAISTRLLEQLPTLTNRQRLLAVILQAMPDYLAARRLDLWESAFQSSQTAVLLGGPPVEPHDDLHEALLDELFEFGRTNLYAAFRLDTTADAFASLLADLDTAGIEGLAFLPPTCW